MTFLFQMLALLAASIIFWRAESAINMMTKSSAFPIRAAFFLLAVGAVALIFAIARGYQPPLSVALPLVGVALLLSCNRRQLL